MENKERVKNRSKVNRLSPQKKGNPSDMGKDKSEVKEPKDVERDEEIRKKYVASGDEPAGNVREQNPNRNTDKPDIDKPSY